MPTGSAAATAAVGGERGLDNGTRAAHTLGVMKKKGEIGQSPDSYSPPSFRGALFMLIITAVGIALMWYAYASMVAEGG